MKTNYAPKRGLIINDLQLYKDTKKSGMEQVGKTQSSKILFAFSEPRTMLEVSRTTGVERASICWEVSKARKARRLFFTGTRECTISKRKAGTYCTRIQNAKEVQL